MIGHTSGPVQTDPLSHSFVAEWSGTNLVYMGLAKTGSLTSDAVWQIRKFTYDGSGNLLTMLYANGNPDYSNVWDNRASLSYS